MKMMEKENTLTVDYLDKTGQKKDLEKMFDEVFAYTLSFLKKEGKFELSLSLVGEEEMHGLNLKYRKMDRPTDVLTFAYREADFIPEPVTDLGCIILCPAIAKKQSKEFKHPFRRELAFLFIHGLLHIFGYEHHDSEKQAEEMFALQNKILDTLPIDFYTDSKKLIANLKIAQSHSLATYSHFKVGAVVVTKDGKYHQGFNIENSSYPASMCGERVALFSTYAQGYLKADIVALGLVTSSSNVGTPCGVCRQVMSELMNLDCPVYIYNKTFKKSLSKTVRELLPYTFTKEDLLA